MLAMCKPPNLLIDTWLQLYHTKSEFNFNGVTRKAEHYLLQHFDSVRDAEKYLFSVGYYKDK